MAVRPMEGKCESGFLYNLLRASADHLARQAMGATVPGLCIEHLSELVIPLPPLAEQRRLAGELREQLAAVAEARAALQSQLQAAAALPAAYLREVFEGGVLMQKSLPLADVMRLQTGYAFKSEWFTPDGVRLLRNTNVMPGRIDWSECAHIPHERMTEFESFALSKGDIVLALDRPLIAEGFKVARLSEADLPCLLLQRVSRFVCSEAIWPGYLFWFLNSDQFIRAVTEHDQSLGVPHVSPRQVASVPIPLPPLPEQRAIAARLDETLAGVAALRSSLEERLAAVERLPGALLREVFDQGGK